LKCNLYTVPCGQNLLSLPIQNSYLQRSPPPLHHHHLWMRKSMNFHCFCLSLISFVLNHLYGDQTFRHLWLTA
jgi:hypothetical protein